MGALSSDARTFTKKYNKGTLLCNIARLDLFFLSLSLRRSTNIYKHMARL